jgi:hypothetical protein
VALGCRSPDITKRRSRQSYPASPQPTQEKKHFEFSPVVACHSKAGRTEQNRQYVERAADSARKTGLGIADPKCDTELEGIAG